MSGGADYLVELRGFEPVISAMRHPRALDGVPLPTAMAFLRSCANTGFGKQHKKCVARQPTLGLRGLLGGAEGIRTSDLRPPPVRARVRLTAPASGSSGLTSEARRWIRP
jgi:hypothetical protein